MRAVTTRHGDPLLGRVPRSFGRSRARALALLAALLLAGCQPAFRTAGHAAAPRRAWEQGNSARLNVFLVLKEPQGPEMQLKFSGLEVLAGPEWVRVPLTTEQVDSGSLGAAQLLLGAGAVSPGSYQRLRLRIPEASLGAEGAQDEFVELSLPTELLLNKGDSESLLITWDVRGSLAADAMVRPALTVFPGVSQLLVGLVYVACPDADTVFVVRSDKDWVVDSFGLPGGPTHLALDPDSSNQRLYVLAAKERAIKVIDLVSQRVVNSFRLTLTSEPGSMVLSPDGRWAYVLDERENSLSRIDLASGGLSARVRLRYPAESLTFLANRNVLAVSSAVYQAVSFHDALSLDELTSVGTGKAPDGMLASTNQLFIAERGGDAVSILDLTTSTIRSRIPVGVGPRRLLDAGDRLCVSNYDGGSVSVVFPAQLAVAQEVSGLGRPLEMAFAPAYRRIYVGDEEKQGLSVIDGPTSRLRGYVPLGSRPLGLAVLP